MSLDVYLEGEATDVYCTCECGHSHIKPYKATLFSRNITHNLNRMADAAGIYKALWRPEEIGASKARELEPILTEGLARLRSDPEHYKKLNPENGWGSYEGLVLFVEEYLKACRLYPDLNVKVSR